MNDGEALNLDRARDLPDLLRTSLILYRQSLGPLLAVTAAIVVTVNVIVGVGLNEFTSHYRSDLGSGARWVQVLVSLLVLSPLVNATAAQLVVELSQGRRPRPVEILQRGLDVFAPALLAVVLYWVAVLAGLFVLIFPGIFLLVFWYFAVQAVTLEGRRGFGALQRSGELVGGSWFRVAGILLVVNLLGNVIPVVALGAAFDAAAQAADAQVVALAGATLIELFSLSFLALAAALLFFDLRARRAGAPPVPPAS